MPPASDSPPDPRVDVLLAEAGWPAVLHDLQRGLVHALNGRASALDAVAQILGMEGQDTEWALDELRGESDKVAAIARMLGALSGRTGGDAEALMAREVAEEAAALLRVHRGLEILEVDVSAVSDPPPFRAPPVEALRVLLVLLSAAGRDARSSGVPRVSVRLEGRDGRAAMTVGWAEATWDGGSAAGILAALRALAARHGGRVDATAEGVEVTFPALRPGGG